ncbi:LysR substrate-binding domain-containing protein [Limoniibacter endophyticus]|uniref:LysR family transcriptional regulator n=1 Tax=Limoniibacter endophyticus TaxID=1565040 RepID=A0A8J3GIL7_9HYPH|nr:LysR substrate-binding domain-containing protein [Limoniibacter endophyticus]GHC78236.1 LysR family transcriptional regulator [Limoniibacter endophyticus]
MEIKQLRYFLAVSELGSFSKAAVVLSVAQPVLSRQIRSLEEELGSELLYRNGRGIVVTEAGEMLVDKARTILNAADCVANEMNSLRASPSGKLVIGLPPTAGSVIAVPLIQRFRESFPRVKLKVQEGYSGHVLEWLSTGRIDVAVLYDAPKTSTLITQPLIEEELLLIGPRTTPLELRDRPVTGAVLGELPLILPSHPHGLRVLIESLLGAEKIYPEVDYEIDSLRATMELVEDGIGYTILPYASVHRKVLAGDLVAMPIIEPRLSRQLVLATSTQRPTTVVTRALAQAVKTLVRDLVDQGVWVPRIADAELKIATVAPRRTVAAVNGAGSAEQQKLH